MSIVHTLYDRFEHLMDDEMVIEALDILDRRRETMRNYVKENSEYDICPECESLDIDYAYNKIFCNQCDWEEDYDVPYPSSKGGGAVVSRTLFSILKECFGRRIKEEAEDRRITKKDIKYLPISIDDFNTGEYTPKEMEFLRNRYQEYINDMDTITANDKYLIHLLILQELRLKKIYQEEAVSQEDLSSKKKREIAVYENLANDLKQTKASREDNEDRSIYDKLRQEYAEKDVEDIINSHTDLEEKRKVLEKSEKRRKEAGNPY